MSQWSPSMTMVGDMFSKSLKSKLDAVCTELAACAAETQENDWRRDDGDSGVSYRASHKSNWWPTGLGTPHPWALKMT
jgi:hypothetical protein